MIYFPYPKYLNAVMDVDMGAALLVTDAGHGAGVGPRPRRGRLHRRMGRRPRGLVPLGADPCPHRSPALVATRRRRTGLAAGVTIDDVERLRSLRLLPQLGRSGPRQLRHRRPTTPDPSPSPAGSSTTGDRAATTSPTASPTPSTGSGPAAAMYALVHGNGYFLTKQAVGVYTRRPPRGSPGPGRRPPGADRPGIDDRPGGRRRSTARGRSWPTPSPTAATANPVTGSSSSTSAAAPPVPGTRVPGTRVPGTRDRAHGSGHTVARTDAATSGALVTHDAVDAAVTVTVTEQGNIARLA